jgi:hypothetical protein
MKTFITILINIALGIVAFLTINYSANHYEDGGCDGGLCGLTAIFHGLPLILVWILEIIAFNLSLKRKWETFIFLAISLVINTIVYNKHHGSEKLSLEPEILYFFAIICLSIYVWTDFMVMAGKDDKLFNEKIQIENIHPILYSAFIFWLLCHLLSCFKLSYIKTVSIELLFIILHTVLLAFIYKKHLWAFYLFFALLIYRTSVILYFNTKHAVQFMSIALIISNLYLLLGIVFQYVRVKKTHFEQG